MTDSRLLISTNRVFGAMLAALVSLTGCASLRTEPLATVDHVDLQRFMGDWYVIANIPTPIEKGAHNAVESYRLDEDGTIATEFSFRKDAFDGPLKRYNPRGFIRDKKTNASWGMRFIWPFKAEYLIIYLNDDYTHTVIGRSKRDYVWIMSRTPQMAAADYETLLQFLVKKGYDAAEVQKVPQKWKIRNQP